MFEMRMWEQIRIVIILSCEQYNDQVMDECPQVSSACQTVWIHVIFIHLKIIVIEFNQKKNFFYVPAMAGGCDR